MSGITFLSDNLFDNATISLTTGTENAQFPLVNLQNDSPSVKFRGIGNTTVILIDLLTTQDITYVAVAADPANSFLITSATFKTSVTTDFSLSTMYTVDLSNDQGIGFKTIPEVNHRYVQLTLTGTGGFTELGKVFIGEAINIPQNSLSISSFAYGYADRSIIKENRYGQKFIDLINTVKSISGDIEFCTKDEQETIDNMLLDHGQSHPLWIIVDENSEAFNEGNFKLTMYGYMENDISWSASGGQLYNTTINMKQAI